MERLCESQRYDRPDLLAQSTTLQAELVVRLEIHPELLGRAEVARQANRRICCDPPLAMHDLVDPTRGTPMDTASLFCVIPNPSMKSFIRISPGWIGSIRSSVIVDEFDIVRTALSPDEAETPLRVDPDSVLPTAIADERGPVTGWAVPPFSPESAPHNVSANVHDSCGFGSARESEYMTEVDPPRRRANAPVA